MKTLELYDKLRKLYTQLLNLDVPETLVDEMCDVLVDFWEALTPDERENIRGRQ